MKSNARIDQQCEKIAAISTCSTKLDFEETSIRRPVVNYDGLIQLENKSGNQGFRRQRTSPRINKTGTSDYGKNHSMASLDKRKTYIKLLTIVSPTDTNTTKS